MKVLSDMLLFFGKKIEIGLLELRHPLCVCNIKVQCKEVKTQEVVICSNVVN